MTLQLPTKLWLAPFVLAGLSLSLPCVRTEAQEASHSSSSHEAESLNHQGLEHLKKKEYDEAIRLFRQALQLQPDSVAALDNLGKALDAAGKDDDAIADFDKALKTAPENAAIYNDKGLALFHEKKYEESAAAYREALKIHPPREE
jgi:tetratricopeptide (TPR) repeat protein